MVRKNVAGEHLKQVVEKKVKLQKTKKMIRHKALQVKMCCKKVTCTPLLAFKIRRTVRTPNF